MHSIVVTYKNSATANMKMADFREIVTTVPFTSTIINLSIILGKKGALIIFADFENHLLWTLAIDFSKKVVFSKIQQNVSTM